MDVVVAEDEMEGQCINIVTASEIVVRGLNGTLEILVCSFSRYMDICVFDQWQLTLAAINLLTPAAMLP